MNKKMLIEIVSKRTNIDSFVVERVCRCIKESFIDALNKGEDIRIAGFGKFTTKNTRERLIKNPITKRYLYCQAKKKVCFSFFKKFKYCIK